MTFCPQVHKLHVHIPSSTPSQYHIKPVQHLSSPPAEPAVVEYEVVSELLCQSPKKGRTTNDDGCLTPTQINNQIRGI